MKRFARLIALVCVLMAARAGAEEAKVETLLEGLTNPCGVAVQPETGHVFVADSGALRVIRLVDGKAQDVITGFAKEPYGEEPTFDAGPLGIAFIDQDTLVVGAGGKPAGGDALLVFTVPKAGEPPIAADKPKATLELPAAEDAQALENFYSVAVTKTGIYTTTEGDAAKGWIARADISGTKIQDFRRYIAATEAVAVKRPRAMTISPRGELVLGHAGEIDAAGDSVLSFFAARDGQLLAHYQTGLHDIAALAYSPQGQLYALDGSAHDASAGGLFQLVATGNGQQVKAQKIAALERPTALAFGPDGVLYVTVLGGKLVRVAMP